MPRSLDALITDLDLLLGDLAQAQADEAGALPDVAPAHRDGAVNLVHYTTCVATTGAPCRTTCSTSG